MGEMSLDEEKTISSINNSKISPSTKIEAIIPNLVYKLLHKSRCPCIVIDNAHNCGESAWHVLFQLLKMKCPTTLFFVVTDPDDTQRGYECSCSVDDDGTMT